MNEHIETQHMRETCVTVDFMEDRTIKVTIIDAEVGKK